MREREFFKDRLSEDELRDLLSDQPPADTFAWRSPRARALGLDPAGPPADRELLRLMLDEPHLIRRPIIRIGQETLFGFDRARVEGLLACGGRKAGE